MKILSALLLSCSVVFHAWAGTITGIVRAEGKAGADDSAHGGKYESREFKFVQRVNYAEMRDFIVYLDGVVPNATSTPPATVQVETKRIAQRGAMFSPHILPIMVGTTVEWPNYDDILHNVFSASEAKQFDLGLYKKGEKKPVLFDKPGRVDVFCSIHTRMSCIILVLENPFFASTNDKGAYSIVNVPPGHYRIRSWHERLPSLVKEIDVPESGDLRVDFTMGIKNLPAL